MDRRARLEAAISRKLVDRVPVSAWGHFFLRETSAKDLAEAMIGFQRRYDWDFVKVHARASYHVEGFGFRYAPSEDPAKGHVTLAQPIAGPEDWRKLRPLPLSDPALAEQLEAVALIRREFGDAMPLIMTVFTPLDVADKLVDRDAELLLRHINEDPDAVEAALGVFAETLVPFVGALAAAGVDGIYFSTKWLAAGKLGRERYRRLAAKYDRMVLEAARGMWANILHVCGEGIDLAAVADYPVPVVHWDNEAPGNPSLAAGATMLGKTVAGGVSPTRLAYTSAAAIGEAAAKAIAGMQTQPFLLGPGCSIQTARTPEQNLIALRKASDAGSARYRTGHLTV